MLSELGRLFNILVICIFSKISCLVVFKSMTKKHLVAIINHIFTLIHLASTVNVQQILHIHINNYVTYFFMDLPKLPGYLISLEHLNQIVFHKYQHKMLFIFVSDLSIIALPYFIITNSFS